MGLIKRMNAGPVTIPVWVLDSVEDVLDIRFAAPRTEVLAQMAAENAGAEPTEVHDYLRPRDVDAVQRLRGWHRMRSGTVVVEAATLCQVRNILDESRPTSTQSARTTSQTFAKGWRS